MNARRVIDLLTGLFLLFGNPLWAQGPSVWRITEEQGLPSQVLYSMVQDSIGYLWLATENGIAKFDGQQFTLIEDPNFPLGEVLSLRIDPLGRIWFMSLNGRLGYILDGQLYGFKPDEFTDDLEIIDFLWTAQSLWVNTKQSAGYHFFRYDLIGDSLAHQAAFVQFEENDQRRLFLLENGEIGSLFQNTIQRFSHEDQQFKRSISASFPEKIWRILGYSEDFLLLLSKSRLYSFKDSTLREVPLVEPLERNDFMFKKGNLLLITGKRGIYQYIQKEGLWEYKASLLPQISPNFIFQDRENNLWIGGNGSGLWMIPDLNIHLYQSSSKEENSTHVGCFEKQSNELLFVGYQNGELGQFELKADTLFYTPLPFHAQNGDFRAIRRQKEGRNFLIIENGRLNSLSPQFDKRWQITNNIKATALFQDTLWIANHLGIGQVAAGPSFEPLHSESRSLTNALIKVGRSYSLLPDEDRLWIGTIKGLYFYKDGRIHPYQGLAANPNFRIADMTTDDRQRLYIATRGNGVALLDRQQILRQYTTDDGLSSNQCFKLALSGDYLWIATDKGLNRLHLPSGAIQVYNKYDGLPSNEILEVAQLGQHRIVIGTTKGVAVFPDTLNPTHDLAPLVHIEGIRVNDQQVKSSALQQLSHRQNNLEFQYIALHFRSRGKVSYFYRVEGLQEEWVETDSRSLRFNALPPGSYTFYVYSKTEDGVRSAEATSVSFHIATPFWQEWWFVLALALVLIGLTWLFVTIRFRQIRKKEMVERSLRERINELRTRALQTQMNPHFVFNALNTVQHSISANDPERAMVTLSKFAQLIRMIFEQSKEKLIALDRELEFLKLYLDFEQMRQGDRVAISFEIDPELRAEASVIKLPPLLIQPVIENAFKHGLLDKETDGLVRISFEKRSDLVQCTIEDNGVGRAYSVQKKEQSANTKHTPSGLKTTAERLALLHNSDAKSSSYLKVTDLYDATGQGAGTKVTLQIPIHKA